MRLTAQEEAAFRKGLNKLTIELVMMKQKLFAKGLPRSAHLLDKVTTELGWEVAERITGKDPR